MRSKPVVIMVIGFFAVTFCPAISWSQVSSMVTPESSDNSIKILSITPSNSDPLHVGDEIEISVEIEYKIAKSPATISLTIQKGETTGDLTDAILGSEMEVVTDQKGTVTLKHKIIVPDTKTIQVFTPLLLEGAISTSTVDMRVYKVVKKTDVK